MSPIVYGGLGIAGLGALILASGPASASIIPSPAGDSTPPIPNDEGDTVAPVNYGASNLSAFLKVLRLGESSDNYSALYGGGNFTSFVEHPAIKTAENPNPFQGSNNSRAAGAYQAQPGTWLDFKRAEGECDFSPRNQDRFAVWAIKRRGAYSDVLMGDIQSAQYKLRNEWSSLADRGASWVYAQFQTNGGALA